MDELVRRRGVPKAALTRVSTFLKAFNETTGSVHDVSVRIESLDGILSRFNSAQEEIEAEANPADIGAQDTERANFELEFFRVKAELMKLKCRLTPSSSNAGRTESGSSLRDISVLPKVNIPQFDGNYLNWTGFFDLFSSIVDANRSLSNAEKLFYLKSSLCGDAVKLLSELSVKNDNYPVAVEVLKKRYDNRRQIVGANLRALCTLLNADHRSMVEMRSLIDGVRQRVCSLGQLGLPVEHWDAWIVFCISERLDRYTRQDWETRTEKEVNPTLKSLLDYLEVRCRAIESAVNDKSRGQSKSNRTHVPGVKAYYTKTDRESVKFVCSKCGGNHSLDRCFEFKKLSPRERTVIVQTHHLCFICLKRGHGAADCRGEKCRECSRPHHRLLHFTKEASYQDSSKKDPSKKDENKNGGESKNSGEQKEDSSVAMCTAGAERLCSRGGKVLPTVIVDVENINGERFAFRALLDECSEENFIRSEVVRSLRLPRKFASLRVHGIGKAEERAKGKVNLKISSSDGKFSRVVEAFILDQVVKRLPTEMIREKIPEFGVDLADPEWWITRRVDMVLGVGVTAAAVLSGDVRIGGLVARRSVFGYCVSGVADSTRSAGNRDSSSYCSIVERDHQTDELVKRFWELEEPVSIVPWTDDEKRCEQFYKETTIRSEDGRYIVRLPLRKEPQFGDTLSVARKRLSGLEQKFVKDIAFADEYHRFMEEYERLGHMCEAKPGVGVEAEFFIPHHAVLRPESSTTKLRVVFDGSCKSSLGVSLNEVLLVGPKLQTDLREIVLKFRMKSVALCADIKQMYRQIRVHEDDQRFQKIVWRRSPEESVLPFQLGTVTYGMSCAPYLALRTLLQMAEDGESSYPLAAAAIRDHFYVDDAILSVDSVEEAVEVKRQLVELFDSAGMKLHKWRSNMPNLCEKTSAVALEFEKCVKTLGILWKPESDEFSYQVSIEGCAVLSKRVILSKIAKLFDPLGWLAPVVIRFKIFMRELWLAGVNWDEPIDGELGTVWTNLYSDLEHVNAITLSRCVTLAEADSVELHGFSDASEVAYGAVIYIVSRRGPFIKSSVVSSRSKVTPVKPVSIARLELCAAVLLAVEIAKVSKALSIGGKSVFAWCDSKTVLAWLRKHPSVWKPFVANRVARVQELLPSEHWHYVSGRENPADIVSRGRSAHDLAELNLWWSGPSWLQEKTRYDRLLISGFNTDEEKRAEKGDHASVSFVVVKNDFGLFQRFSSFIRLQRVVAYVRRFIHKCRVKSERARFSGQLLSEELEDSSHLLIRLAQRESFSKEIEILSGSGDLHSKNKILPLNPMLDTCGILRVGGRLKNSDLKEGEKYPMLLERSHPLTKLIVLYYHKKLFHANIKILRQALNEYYWIVNIRDLIRNIVRKCVICSRYRVRTSSQLMGDLPQERVTIGRPFSRIGVDYAGPITIRRLGVRKPSTIKAYIAVFVCLAIKAIHIEVVSELSTKAFLSAFNRFIGRRGVPRTVMSDNGKNFIGAAAELREFFRGHGDDIVNYATTEGFSWKFIPPHTPHMGGLWEAGVKSIKHHLVRVTGARVLTFEELTTVLIQIEGLLNSRPLTYGSTDLSDLSVLTPAHFLVGTSSLVLPQTENSDRVVNLRDRWTHLKSMHADFWRHWSREYLNTLQQRNKWRKAEKNLNVGDLVILKDSNLKPAYWKIGRVLRCNPGSDGVVRVVVVKTENGELKRSINKLVPLLLDEEHNCL